MSIFGKIMGAIFGAHAEAATPASTSETGEGNATSTSNAAAVGSNVDVAAILDKAVAKKTEKLAWRTSIVDLMKALDVDSSPRSGEVFYFGSRGRRLELHSEDRFGGVFWPARQSLFHDRQDHL